MVFSRALNKQQNEEFYGDDKPAQVTPGATHTLDVTQVETTVVTMTTNITVAAPTNTNKINAGNKTYLIFVQDASGGRTLTWNAAWRNAPSGLGGSATAGQRASFEFRWDGVSMQYTGGSTAFA
jgi:hypothetical protein